MASLPARRSAAVALLTLLAVCLAVGAAAAAAPDATEPQRVTPVENTTSQATPDEITRRGYGTASLDVAGAVGADAARLDGRLRELTVAQRLDGTTDRAARLTVARTVIDETEARIEALDARQGRLFAAYGNGSLDTTTMFRRLAALDAAVDGERAVLRRIERLDTAGSLIERTRRFDARLVTLPSPLTDRIRASLAGETEPQVLYVAGGPDGLVMAAMVEQTYRREATIRSAYAPDAPNQFATGEQSPIVTALDRFSELYPWLTGGGASRTGIDGFPDLGVYLLSPTHEQGQIWSYLSGATREVFHERQTKRPELVPVTDRATNQTADRRLAVATTSPTGPLNVTLADPLTGDPVDAPVLVDGHRVGTTGPDGQLWTVQPEGRFRVTAVGATNLTVRTPN